MISISIIFPAFDEVNKIEVDILAADKFIYENDFLGEIIVIDDGSKDGTFEKASAIRSEINTKLLVSKIVKNQGKGNAIAEGVKLASCEYILYADVGLTVPFKDALKGINYLSNNKYDIANGSRKMLESKIIKDQDVDRKIISSLFIWFAKTFLKVPKSLTDTQCGFKIYKKNVAKKLYSELKIKGFMYDIAVIRKALKLNYKIIEFPVHWKCDRDSRLTIVKSPWRILKDTFLILSNRF